MKKIIAFISLFFVFSCTTTKVEKIPYKSNPMNLHSSWTGEFKSEHHTDGIILNWSLYNNGTMNGQWKTKNNSTAIDVQGVYSIKGNRVSFNGNGILIIHDKTKTNITFLGDGEFNKTKTKAKGNFFIQIEHPKFPNDSGSWVISRT